MKMKLQSCYVSTSDVIRVSIIVCECSICKAYMHCTSTTSFDKRGVLTMVRLRKCELRYYTALRNDCCVSSPVKEGHMSFEPVGLNTSEVLAHPAYDNRRVRSCEPGVVIMVANSGHQSRSLYAKETAMVQGMLDCLSLSAITQRRGRVAMLSDLLATTSHRTYSEFLRHPP